MRALGALPRILGQEGHLAVTVYERKPWTFLNGKYLARPFTRRLNKHFLLALIRSMMPVLFPLTEVLFRLPYLGRSFAFALPVANYVHLGELTWQQRYELALLDTFDRLAPEYDQPLSEQEVCDVLSREGIVELRRQPNPGVNVVGRKRICQWPEVAC